MILITSLFSERTHITFYYYNNKFNNYETIKNSIYFIHDSAMDGL